VNSVFVLGLLANLIRGNLIRGVATPPVMVDVESGFSVSAKVNAAVESKGNAKAKSKAGARAKSAAKAGLLLAVTSQSARRAHSVS
jgi:hypothetical protein